MSSQINELTKKLNKYVLMIYAKPSKKNLEELINNSKPLLELFKKFDEKEKYFNNENQIKKLLYELKNSLMKPKNIKRYIKNKLSKLSENDFKLSDDKIISKIINENTSSSQVKWLKNHINLSEVKNIFLDAIKYERQKILEIKDKSLISYEIKVWLEKNNDRRATATVINKILFNLYENKLFKSDYWNNKDKLNYAENSNLKDKIVKPLVYKLRKIAQENGFSWYIISNSLAPKDNNSDVQNKERLTGYFFTKNKLIIHNYLKKKLVDYHKKIKKSQKVYIDFKECLDKNESSNFRSCNCSPLSCEIIDN